MVIVARGANYLSRQLHNYVSLCLPFGPFRITRGCLLCSTGLVEGKGHLPKTCSEYIYSVNVKVMFRPTGSHPVCLGVKLSSLLGPKTRFLLLSSDSTR